MAKRIIAILLLSCMALGLLAACSSGVIDTEKAKQIALEDMGIKESQAEVHVHIGEHEGVAGFNVYVTYEEEQTAYFIDGKSGEILSKGEGSHSH